MAAPLVSPRHSTATDATFADAVGGELTNTYKEVKNDDDDAYRAN
jgi:hypothetical protein